MQSIKREIGVGSAISALALAGALCWGSPFVAASSGAQAQQQPQPGMPQVTPEPQQQQQMPQSESQPSQARTESFTGTVVREGSQYVLRTSTGETYRLTNASKAKAYDGKSVTVTGKVDSQSKTIQVQDISGS